ncbi:isochorismate synthase [Vibrio aphrogenes]|uniref:isochorismate synthase n=1 Tax=Vibrio aphrogenes TaxID=1891186 RepID=UPI000B34D3F7|nr:isochorismate synthase [Vibrio aphrogenes]
MSALHQVIERLIKRIRQGLVPNETRISESVDLPHDFSAVDWLSGQELYPRFYWQSRDAREEVVALAQIHTFTDPLAAYTMLGEEQRVWGGKAFDSEHAKTTHQSSYFFLPKIELIRQDDQWTLNANVSGDGTRTIAALTSLNSQYQALESLMPQPSYVVFSPQFDEWKHILSKALSAIDANEFEKVVLARKTVVELAKPISAVQLLKSSRDLNLDSFHFLFSLAPNQSFVGSTPERLYRRLGDMVETEALAGTIGRSDDPQEDHQLASWLLNDDKNQRENQIVVNDIIERLTPYTESIEVQPDAQLIQLRKVQHLKRHIHGNLSLGVKGVQLLSALQPTAAIAGLPREDSLNFIRMNEPFTRGWYSGSVGYFGHNKAEFCVSIRSASLVDNTVKLYAGAGIVAGSEAEFEWQELNRKTATLLNLITDYPIEQEDGEMQ